MSRPRSSIGKSRAVFSVRLKRLRIQAGLTQKDLERSSGIPKSRISRYENGHLLPSFQGLRRLSRSLGVPESALLGEPQEPYAAFLSALRRHGVEFSSDAEAEEVASRVVMALERARVRPVRPAASGL